MAMFTGIFVYKKRHSVTVPKDILKLVKGKANRLEGHDY